MISETMGHFNFKTIKNYWNGFKIAKEKEYAKMLMYYLNE